MHTNNSMLPLTVGFTCEYGMLGTPFLNIDLETGWTAPAVLFCQPCLLPAVGPSAHGRARTNTGTAVERLRVRIRVVETQPRS